MSVERITPDAVMTPDYREAVDATAQARRGAEDLWNGLARIVQCRGWTVLGFASFRQWCSTELDMRLSQADQYLKKTNMLIEMAEATGLTPAQLEKRVPVRSMNRRRSTNTPLTDQMRRALSKLSGVPILANPTELQVAILLRNQLNRLIGDGDDAR